MTTITKLKAALAALEANHKWNQDYDDHDGYPDSDLESANMKSITDLRSVIAEMEAAEPVAILSEALAALEVAQDNLGPHDDNCYLHDTGEYAACFCGKDATAGYLRGVVKRIATAIEAHPQPDATAYAQSLAKSIHAAHYRKQALQWECADDLLTVLTQIDNMVAGLTNTKANPSEADELLQNLGLNPEQYRTDGGAINHRKVKAAILHPDEYPLNGAVEIQQAVNRFLGWRLPKEFCPDSFISFDREKHSQWGGYPNSWPIGTNLLTADQARAMFEYCFERVAQPKAEPCQHSVADARNPVVKNGYICVKCGALFSAADHAQPKAEPAPLEEYDAGLLNDFGGGKVDWWQDYIRAELGRAFDHYQSQVAQPKAEPVQEPVAYVKFKDGEVDYDSDVVISNTEGDCMDESIEWRPVYAAAPQAKPLTDESIDDIAGGRVDYFDRRVFARAIEAAHGIKP